MPIKIISTRKYPGDTDSYLKLIINGKEYVYETSDFIINKFQWKLDNGQGFKALNFLKKNSKLMKEGSETECINIQSIRDFRKELNRNKNNSL